jgi:hypothetical protein
MNRKTRLSIYAIVAVLGLGTWAYAHFVMIPAEQAQAAATAPLGAAAVDPTAVALVGGTATPIDAKAVAIAAAKASLPSGSTLVVSGINAKGYPIYRVQCVIGGMCKDYVTGRVIGTDVQTAAQMLPVRQSDVSFNSVLACSKDLCTDSSNNIIGRNPTVQADVPPGQPASAPQQPSPGDAGMAAAIAKVTKLLPAGSDLEVNSVNDMGYPVFNLSCDAKTGCYSFPGSHSEGSEQDVAKDPVDPGDIGGRFNISCDGTICRSGDSDVIGRDPTFR